MQKLHKSTNIWGATFTIALLAIFITGCATAEPTVTPNPTPTPPPTTTSTKYTNGTYTATGSYVTPGGIEDVNVSVTLKNDLISSATFSGSPHGPITKQMQAKFRAGFQELVVGKAIDSVSLGVVNGSSLSPKGFMDALAKIKVEAKV